MKQRADTDWAVDPLPIDSDERDRLWAAVIDDYALLRRTVCGYEADPALQEDLTQDILLAVWKSLDRLEDPSRLRAYVLRIAHNLGASHIRSERRRVSTVPLTREPVAASSDRMSAELESLLAAVRSLPLPLRQVLLLQLEGFNYDEIAQTLGISSSNVGVRAHRARQQLAEILGAEGDGQ